MPGSKSSDAPENGQFGVSFIHFAIEEGAKEEIRVGNLRDGIAGAGTGFWASSGVVMP